jgi:hypothetical protein
MSRKAWNRAYDFASERWDLGIGGTLCNVDQSGVFASADL